jgi:coenzyme F420-reducing hydrogenase alpha subunit
MDERTISVEGLSRVEGEGSLRAVVRDGVVDEVELAIFEPPRFFEALLVGRHAHEAPDITSRICGICPVAYQLSACQAIEAAAGVASTAGIESLRRLLYCGEWIQSHALHVYLLHAPDFFGCRDAVELAKREPEAVRRGLELKKVGNLIMETVGGRAIHPVNVRVGGFYRSPSSEQIAALAQPLRRARELALSTV